MAGSKKEKPPEGRFVKGSVLIDYVKLLRANPELPWKDHLSAEDFSHLKEMLLPSSWYPVELYDHLGLAVFKLISKEKVEAVRGYGRFLADKMNADNPGLISKGRPSDTLNKYRAILSRFFSFPVVEFEEVAPGRARAKFQGQPGDVAVRQLVEVTQATIHRLIELSGGWEIAIKADYQAGREINTLEITWQE